MQMKSDNRGKKSDLSTVFFFDDIPGEVKFSNKSFRNMMSQRKTRLLKFLRDKTAPEIETHLDGVTELPACLFRQVKQEEQQELLGKLPQRFQNLK